MNSNAIIFVYNGDAPQAETIRRMAEAIMNTISIDHQSLVSYTLDEKEIAKSMVSSALSKEDKAVETCPEENAVIYLNGVYGASLRENVETTIDRITNHYVFACISGDNDELTSAIRIIATTGMKVQTMKMVKNHIGITLVQSKILVDCLEDIYSRCQGHIVG